MEIQINFRMDAEKYRLVKHKMVDLNLNLEAVGNHLFDLFLRGEIATPEKKHPNRYVQMLANSLKASKKA